MGELAEIRRALRKNDVTYHVVKNRLMRIAAEGPNGEALSGLLNGPTAIAFGTDEAGTAKAVLDATRPFNRIVKIKGAVLGGKAIDADGVTALAALRHHTRRPGKFLRQAPRLVAREKRWYSIAPPIEVGEGSTARIRHDEFAAQSLPPEGELA